MVYYYKDLHDGIVFPIFTGEQTAELITGLVLGVLSSAADFLCLYALVKQRNIPQDSFFIISLTCADLAFAIVNTIDQLINSKVYQCAFFR